MPIFHNLPDWLAHLETAHPVGIDMGLSRITRVKEALGLRIDAAVFTVGGTNGKGSTCAILERILLEAGYKVGLHTSPHLIQFNERARLNGEQATDAQLLPHFEAVERARTSCRSGQPDVLRVHDAGDHPHVCRSRTRRDHPGSRSRWPPGCGQCD
jgi:dihydrofolate synthase/folylpolyglutamate synthase